MTKNSTALIESALKALRHISVNNMGPQITYYAMSQIHQNLPDEAAMDAFIQFGELDSETLEQLAASMDQQQQMEFFAETQSSICNFHSDLTNRLKLLVRARNT